MKAAILEVDQLIADCSEAIKESNPLPAVKDVLERAVRSPKAVLAALPIERAEIVPLYASPELSVMKVVWAPGMRFRPHNHLMWAAIRDVRRARGQRVLPADE